MHHTPASKDPKHPPGQPPAPRTVRPETLRNIDADLASDKEQPYAANARDLNARDLNAREFNARDQ